MDLEDIGQVLRAARKERNMTQADLAKASGMSRTRIDAIENGRAVDMRLASLSSLLEAVGMEISLRAHNQGRPVFEDIVEEEADDAPGLG